MASTTRAAVVTEAEYGCGLSPANSFYDRFNERLTITNIEHLRVLLEKSDTVAGRFYDSFIQAHTKLAIKRPQSAASSRLTSLKPTYTCLECSEVCLSSRQSGHFADAGHGFCELPLLFAIFPFLFFFCLRSLPANKFEQLWIPGVALSSARAAKISCTTTTWKSSAYRRQNAHPNVSHSEKLNVFAY
jgi:hypothetical protein